MEKNLTAVEWFYEKVKKFVEKDTDEFEDLFNYYYQAKRMEYNKNLEHYISGINDYKNNFAK